MSQGEQEATDRAREQKEEEEAGVQRIPAHPGDDWPLQSSDPDPHQKRQSCTRNGPVYGEQWQWGTVDGANPKTGEQGERREDRRNAGNKLQKQNGRWQGSHHEDHGSGPPGASRRMELSPTKYGARSRRKAFSQLLSLLRIVEASHLKHAVGIDVSITAIEVADNGKQAAIRGGKHVPPLPRSGSGGATTRTKHQLLLRLSWRRRSRRWRWRAGQVMQCRHQADDQDERDNDEAKGWGVSRWGSTGGGLDALRSTQDGNIFRRQVGRFVSELRKKSLGLF